MKVGDIVRFHTEPEFWEKRSADIKWKHGLLIRYHTWEKIAKILYEGTIISVRAENTQLAIRSPENI